MIVTNNWSCKDSQNDDNADNAWMRITKARIVLVTDHVHVLFTVCRA